MAAKSPPHIWIAAALVFLCVICYWPVYQFEFIDFDDPLFTTGNPLTREGFNLPNFCRIWVDTHTLSLWMPVALFSHMIDYTVFGDFAGGHHISSVVIHAGAAVLLYAALFHMTGAVWASAWVAALFAAHPYRVDAVAQIASRKDLLSAVFVFLTFLAYHRYVRKPTGKGYAFVTAAFLLAGASKPMVVTIPCVMLLFDYWPLKRTRDWLGLRREDWRTNGRLIVEKTPLFLIAIALQFVTVYATSRDQVLPGTNRVGYLARIENAFDAYGTYLLKTVWPTGLAAYYPMSLGPREHLWPVASGILIVVFTLGAISLRKAAPYAFVGWLWFAGMLVPVAGFVQYGTHAMADRYMYLPLIGLLIAVAWAALGIVSRWPGSWRVIAIGGVLAILGSSAVTMRQVWHWRDSETIFRHTLAVTKDNALIENNLGVVLRRRGEIEEAEQHFREAVRIVPDYFRAAMNYADLLNETGRFAEAARLLEQQIKHYPDNAEAHVRLGWTYYRLRDHARAEEHARRGLELDSDLRPAQVLLRQLERGPGASMEQTQPAPGPPPEAFDIAPERP